MIGNIFQFIIQFLASMIQIIVWPINQFISATLPDLSVKITEVTSYIPTMFDSIDWALGVVPTPIVVTLLFILSVEVARHTIFVSTHVINMVFSIIKRIKFW